ncbi:putative membrane protein [Mycoplasmoides fastidiosum]|uniref:Membrane protein n=1 Tax=Mycoplasmoides fastidiosum TaxID=92758 RepID=A0ABU0LYK6_9BACT|nr:putative membrane protein [Mycoplasmoides fastidiosum]
MKLFYSYRYLTKFILLNCYLILLMVAIVLDLTQLRGATTFSYSLIFSTIFNLMSYWLNERIHYKTFQNFQKEIRTNQENEITKKIVKTKLFLVYFLIILIAITGLWFGILINYLVNNNIFSILFIILGIVPNQLAYLFSIFIIFLEKFVIRYKL